MFVLLQIDLSIARISWNFFIRAFIIALWDKSKKRNNCSIRSFWCTKCSLWSWSQQRRRTVCKIVLCYLWCLHFSWFRFSLFPSGRNYSFLLFLFWAKKFTSFLWENYYFNYALKIHLLVIVNTLQLIVKVCVCVWV